MRADTVDCVMFILRAASMKLPVSATIRKVRARVTSIVLTSSRVEVSSNLSIEISDRGHRKIPFVDGLILTKLVNVPTELGSRFGSNRSGSQWKDEHHEGQSEEARRQESRSEEAGREEEEEVVISP